MALARGVSAFRIGECNGDVGCDAVVNSNGTGHVITPSNRDALKRVQSSCCTGWFGEALRSDSQERFADRFLRNAAIERTDSEFSNFKPRQTRRLPPSRPGALTGPQPL